MRFNYRYIVLNTKNGKGYATFALLWEKKLGVNNENLLNCYASVSFCSPHDKFTKKMGRTISAGRVHLNKNSVHVCDLPCSDNLFITNNDFVGFLPMLFENAPRWALKAFEKSDYKLGLRTTIRKKQKKS